LKDPAVAAAAAAAASQALQDPQLKQQINQLTKDTAIWLLNDPYINLQILELLKCDLIIFSRPCTINYLCFQARRFLGGNAATFGEPRCHHRCPPADTD